MVDLISVPSHEVTQKLVLVNTNLGPSWMDKIVNFLCHDKLPEDKREAQYLRVKITRFWISPAGDLYIRSYLDPYVLCVHSSLVEYILFKSHEGMCGLYSEGRSLAHRALTQGYWWLYMQKDT